MQNLMNHDLRVSWSHSEFTIGRLAFAASKDINYHHN
uniref:Uncharacterized protein n=1 Tax=Arundo donax TaxID=35708 RepID=A0A0A8ZDB3_ARUDO